MNPSTSHHFVKRLCILAYPKQYTHFIFKGQYSNKKKMLNSTYHKKSILQKKENSIQWS